MYVCTYACIILQHDTAYMILCCANYIYMYNYLVLLRAIMFHTLDCAVPFFALFLFRVHIVAKHVTV